jgi:predicted transcriptional regulator of viral defense system
MMKRQKQSLGDLATQFFAFVQLRKKQTVSTGELAAVLQISPEQEWDLLRRLARSGWIIRLRRGLYLIPQQIPAGGRWSPGEYYQICGPSAFNFHGLDEQVPQITYAYNNRISGERRVGNLRFSLIKVSDARLGSTTTLELPEGVRILYCSKARTLMDAVYDWSRFNGLPRAYEWIEASLRKDPKLAGELTKVTIQFGNQATLRRIGFVLKNCEVNPRILKPLRAALSDSKALIPSIPNRPARGRINREWGLIVNDQQG